MISKQALLTILNDIAPLNLAMEFDNCGLLVDANDTFTKALICVDITKTVLIEAINEKCDLIISHHPLIFDAIKRIDKDSIVFKAIKHQISIYAAHTNMDMVKCGLNDTLASMLSLKNGMPLQKIDIEANKKIVVYAQAVDIEKIKVALTDVGVATIGDYQGCFFSVEGTGNFTPTAGTNPTVGEVAKQASVKEVKLECVCKPERIDQAISAIKKVHRYEEPVIDVYDLSYPSPIASFGCVGTLAEAVSLETFVNRAKQALHIDDMRVCGDMNSQVKTVAVCCGSGGDLIFAAKNRGADVLFTGEAKHHHFIDAQNLGIAMIEAGHYATEKHFVNLLTKHLQAKLNKLNYDLAVEPSKTEKPPYMTI